MLETAENMGKKISKIAPTLTHRLFGYLTIVRLFRSSATIEKMSNRWREQRDRLRGQECR